MKRKAKLLVGTWYAVKVGDKYINDTADLGNFARAILHNSRAAAREDARGWMDGGGRRFSIVPVRCRPLVSKRANPKRTG